MKWWQGLSWLIVGVFLMVLGPVKANAAACSLTAIPNGSSVVLSAKDCVDGNFYMRIYKKDDETKVIWSNNVSVHNGSASQTAVSLEAGNYTARLAEGLEEKVMASSDFSITTTVVTPPRCGDPCNPNSTTCPNECSCTMSGNQWFCGSVELKWPTPSIRPTDIFCTGTVGTDNPEVNTALGCVPATASGFVKWLLPYLFGIGGGIAFLLMVYGFILLATSGGDPKAVQGAKETITSAITGLLISIFAIFLLRLIAVNILHIPGLM